MATPGEMIAIVADALAIQPATVTSYHRALRESGLVTKGGRGRSAPTMTAEDVARLLIALMGSENIEEAATACQLLADAHSSEGMDEEFGKTEYPSLSLLEAVVILLQQMNGQVGSQSGVPLSYLGTVSRNVILEISGSTLEARIIDGAQELPFQNLPSVPISYPEDWAEMSIEDRLLARAHIHGMETKRTVDAVVLSELAKALPE